MSNSSSVSKTPTSSLQASRRSGLSALHCRLTVIWPLTNPPASAKAWYPLTGIEVGGGETNNIAFAANSETSFKFPLSIVYSQAKDPNGAMLKDIADRCGFTGNTKREIDVKYTITVRPYSACILMQIMT